MTLARTLLPTLLLASASASEFQVRLISQKISEKLPDDVRQSAGLFGNWTGELQFLVTGENIRAVINDSLVLTESTHKWEQWNFANISDDGKYASFQLNSEDDLLPEWETSKLAGTIQIATSAEKKEETVTLQQGAAATTVGPFEIQFKKNSGLFSSGPGIQIKGPHEAIASLTVIQNDQENKKSGWSSGSDKSVKTYNFQEKIEGETTELKISYWVDLQTHTIPFHK